MANRDPRADAPAGLIKRVVQFVSHDLWMIEVGSLPGFKAWLTRSARVGVIAVREFARDRCVQHAMALTYLTIFTLPALLALVFAVAKGLGVFEKLKTGPINAFMGYAFPDSAGESSDEIRKVVDQIFTYVEAADLKPLGVVGVVFLLYAAVKMLGSVESTFNHIWGVKRARSLLRKFTDYLAIVAVVPLMLLLGTGFTTLLESERLRGFLGDKNSFFFSWAIPLMAICLGMTLVLATLPNTRVPLRSALVGGLLAGISWQLAQVLFVKIQIGLMNANPIFSSFAAVPLLLSWIYLSWVTLFVGCEVSHALENVDLITSVARTGKVDQSFRESMAPRIVGRVVARFLAGQAAPNAAELSAELNLGPRTAASILDQLVEQRILAETSGEDFEAYLPARDPATIRLADLLVAMRREPGCELPLAINALDERAGSALSQMQADLSSSSHNLTLTELVGEGQEA